MSGGRCGRSRRQSCAARCRRRGRSCPHWCGRDCPARCGAKCGRVPQERPHERRHRRRTACCGDEPRRARRAPRRARRAAPSRGGHGGHRHNAVEPRQGRVVAATAVSAASRRASGARSERSERRREGYPPEGPRPRSGLGRVARSRSDAPRLTDPSGTPFTIGGIDRITTGTVVVGNGCTAAIIGGADAMLSSRRTRG